MPPETAIVPQGEALALLLVSIILLGLSIILTILRFYSRSTIKAIGLDDWLMLAGLVFFIVACVATSLASFNGVGTEEKYITAEYDKRGRMWFMFFQLFYVLSTVPIKASICVAMLRITTRRLFRWILYAVIFLSTVACIVTDIAVLAWCKPVSATWDPATGTCADASVITNVSFFISSVSILTDWTCAIIPAFILWDVQLKFKIKASVAVVLGLGVLASSATLVRLKYLLAYNEPSNYLLGIANIAIWSIVESGVGIIAGSLATLRPLLRHIPFFRDGSSGGKSSGADASRGTGFKLNTMRYGTNTNKTHIEGSAGNEWDRLSEGDTESQKGIIVKEGGKITVTKDVVQETTEAAESQQKRDGHGRHG